VGFSGIGPVPLRECDDSFRQIPDGLRPDIKGDKYPSAIDVFDQALVSFVGIDSDGKAVRIPGQVFPAGSRPRRLLIDSSIPVQLQAPGLPDIFQRGLVCNRGIHPECAFCALLCADRAAVILFTVLGLISVGRIGREAGIVQNLEIDAVLISVPVHHIAAVSVPSPGVDYDRVCPLCSHRIVVSVAPCVGDPGEVIRLCLHL